jgi:hypothetical protein
VRVPVLKGFPVDTDNSRFRYNSSKTKDPRLLEVIFSFLFMFLLIYFISQDYSFDVVLNRVIFQLRDLQNLSQVSHKGDYNIKVHFILFILFYLFFVMISITVFKEINKFISTNLLFKIPVEGIN